MCQDQPWLEHRKQREDGYHNLETVFYPIPLYDALEIKYMDEKFPSDTACDLKVTGNVVDCDEQKIWW